MDTRRRPIEIDTLLWRGVEIEMTYDPNWLYCDPDSTRRVARVTIRSINPEGARLPITRTGSCRRFYELSYLADAGERIAALIDELDLFSSSPDWKAYVAEHGEPHQC